MKEFKELNIIVCGVGGQGNILIERILGISAVQEGYQVRAADTFGAAQRGGSVLSHIRLGTEVTSSLVPQGRCHVVLGLEPGEALRTATNFLGPNGLVIVNLSPVLPVSVKVGESAYPSVGSIRRLMKMVTQNVIELNATALAKKTTGSERAMNIVMTGVLMALDVLPFSPETIKQVLGQTTGGFAEQNIRAFGTGFEAGKQKRLVQEIEFPER